LFKWHGIFITPTEMTQALCKDNKCIKDCAVTLIDDRPVAFVVLQDGTSPSDTLKEELLTNVTTKTIFEVPMVPDDIVFVKKLPTNERHKLDTKQLLEIYKAEGKKSPALRQRPIHIPLNQSR